MSIHSWLKRLRRSEDAAEVERAEEQWYESADERPVTSGDVEGMRADTAAAMSLHEVSIEDAVRLSDD